MARFARNKTFVDKVLKSNYSWKVLGGFVFLLVILGGGYSYFWVKEKLRPLLELQAQNKKLQAVILQLENQKEELNAYIEKLLNSPDLLKEEILLKQEDLLKEEDLLKQEILLKQEGLLKEEDLPKEDVRSDFNQIEKEIDLDNIFK